MTLRSAIVALVLLSPSSALAADPGTTGALSVPANQIVGLWSTDADVGPCGGPLVLHVHNNLLFHAGGTVIENIPPTTFRNQGMGTWSYDRSNGWQLRLRFDRFDNDVYVGYTTIDRTLWLSADGRQLTGPVRAKFYADDGTLVQELCGEATSERLQ